MYCLGMDGWDIAAADTASVLIDNIKASRQANYERGCFLIVTCDGAVIRTDGHNVEEHGIPPGVIGRHDPGTGPVQYCAHMSTVQYHYIAFDRKAFRVQLSRQLKANGQSDDLFDALSRAKEFMERGPDECGTTPTVQLLNAMATTSSNNPGTCINKRPKVMSCIARSECVAFTIVVKANSYKAKANSYTAKANSYTARANSYAAKANSYTAKPNSYTAKNGQS